MSLTYTDFAIELLDDVRACLGLTPASTEPEAGAGISTQGCLHCGGSMRQQIETDSQGKPTGNKIWICGTCGRMA